MNAGQAKHMSRAAHILFHQDHAGTGLDVQSTGIEDHALADQRQRRRSLVGPTAFGSDRADDRRPGPTT